ncbi:hypothetical protein evm_000773 [Chilo suppressalis]|nr:hypothetical protein evm_000773 [Chilo suppressalis]
MGEALLILLALSWLFTSTSSIMDPCERWKTCSDCITDPTVCVWCASKNFNDNRCKSAKSYEPKWCPEPVQNPVNNVTVFYDLDFNSTLGNVIQVKPQKFEMRLRPGIPAEFNIFFKTAVDYPVDLYFILDASLTMETMRSMIVRQSDIIYYTMRNLTKNIHLGIGTFIDKNTVPYTNKIDSNRTYSFKHRLNLTDNFDEFNKTVSEFQFGYNYDEPEGGFDALAQAISCKERIGWNKESRKIIVVLSDAGSFHSAGDGLIAGIFKPYDGGCYLNDDGMYTKELEMDYPSVSIINKMAAAEEILIIFVVKTQAEYYYSRVCEVISGSKYISYNSDNTKTTSLLEKIYDEITKPVKLKVHFKPGERENFHISFDPDCVNANTDCKVKNGQEKHFKGTIKVLNYFDEDKTSINITFEGIKEKITLDIKIIKECECTSKGIPKAVECSEAGTFECGICQCNPKSYGEKCACSTNEYSKINDNSTCIAPGDTELCGGRGSCICGKCICKKDSPYEGAFCQYNKGKCPRENKLVCNGHGRCEDEKCICTDDNWTGRACECPRVTESCMGNNGKVCSGLGECICGKCVCNRTAFWDARENQDRLCHILPCPDCHRPQCIILEQCALCIHNGEPECPNCAYFKANVTQSPLDPTWNICPDIRVDVGCYTRFMYRYNDNDYVLEMLVQAERNCLESYYLYGGICLASLILIGVATLVAWKWLTDAQDRREYERFLKENEEDLSEPCDNPTFIPASTTTTNPAFRKLSVDHTIK